MPTVLITGAGHGIGRATAHALHAKGYRLALIDRDADAINTLASLGAVVACDVTDRESLQQAILALEAQAGAIDILLACAGVGALTIVPDLNISALRRMLEVNVIGVAQTIEAVLPGMIDRKRGHIIGIASVAGFRGLPWMISYSASKAGLIAYLEGIRPGLKRRGITVTTVCPGFVRTAITWDTPFRSPMKMLSPEQAAMYLVRAVERRPRDYVFPWSTKFGMAILNAVPNRVFDWMMDRAGPRALTSEF